LLSEPLPPIQIGQFELFEPIGRGGMGIVWFGHHVEQMMPVAIKVIGADYANNPLFVEAFEAEVQAVARLHHPGIVMVMDYGTIPESASEQSGGVLKAGNPYLVMEMASEGTLEDLYAPRQWADLRALLLEILDALGHAHARGVIHRDVKPANILMCGKNDQRPGLKLSDFGLAAAGERMHSEKMTGTPAFMPPELCDGQWRDHGPWTDLYSLGCVAFAMATGNLPFDDSNPMQVVLKQFTADPPKLEPRLAVPAGFEGWLQRLLAKAPKDRFRWAADAAFELQRLGEPASKTISLPTGLRFKGPPLPTTWKRSETPKSPPQMIGVGLGLYGLRSIPLVGREQERERIWTELKAVYASGRARAVLLRGEPGTGKSRVAEWMADRAHELGAASTLRASHSAAVAGRGEGVPRMISVAIRTLGLNRVETRVRVAHTLRNYGITEEYDYDALTELLVPATPDDIAAGARVVRFASPEERHTVARRFLELLAKERPVLVLLDDVQWGLDSLAFAKHLHDAQTRIESPVLVLATVRDNALQHRPLEQALVQELLERDDVAVIDVGPMSSEDHQALIHELLMLEGDVANQVRERTAGNPLFAVQLVGDWVQRGVLEVGANGFKLREGTKLHIPDDIHDLWSKRIEQLIEDVGGGGRMALEIAAALGREVHTDEWLLTCEHAGATRPDDLVHKLIATGMGVPTPDGWAFKHGMLRESVQRLSVENDRWRRLNRDCAKMVSSLHAEGQPGREERIGRHLIEAGELRTSLKPLLTGAAERNAHSEYKQALELLAIRREALGGLRVPRQHLVWSAGLIVEGVAHRLVGELDRAVELTEEAAAIARACGDAQTLGEALVSLGHLAKESGELAKATDYYRKALEDFEGSGENKCQVDCYWGLGVIALSKGEIAEARSLLEKARSSSEKMGYALLIADSYHQLGGIARMMGELDEAEYLVEQGRLAYERVGNRTGVANCINGLAEVKRFRGELTQAERGYREALAIHETLGGLYVSICEANLALVLLERGEFEEANVLLDRVRIELERQRSKALLGMVYLMLLPCCANRGDAARYDKYFVLGSKLLLESKMVDPDIAFPALLATKQALERGWFERAKQALSISEQQFRAIGTVERLKEVAALFELIEQRQRPTE